MLLRYPRRPQLQAQEGQWGFHLPRFVCRLYSYNCRQLLKTNIIAVSSPSSVCSLKSPPSGPIAGKTPLSNTPMRIKSMLGLVHPLMRLQPLLELSNWCVGYLPGQIYIYYLLTWSMVVDISFTGLFRETLWTLVFSVYSFLWFYLDELGIRQWLDWTYVTMNRDGSRVKLIYDG